MTPYIVVPIVAWVVAQVTKFGLKAAQGDIQAKYLYSSGGMPSSHAAIVLALAVTALIEGGVDSPGFGISVVLALIVLVDAVNVRRAVGQNRQALKTLYRLVPLAKRRTKDDDVLDEFDALGHTPVEVVVGAILGAATAYMMLYPRAVEADWGLQARPTGVETTFYTVLFSGLLVVGFLLSVVMMRSKSKRLPTGKAVRASVRNSFIYPALAGLLFVWARNEEIAYASRRWLFWLAILYSISALVYYSITLYDGIRDRYKDDRKQKEETKRRSKKPKRKGSRRR